MTAPQGAQNQMNAAQESAGEGMRPGAESARRTAGETPKGARRMTATKRRAKVPRLAKRGRTPQRRQIRRCAIANPSLPSPAGTAQRAVRASLRSNRRPAKRGPDGHAKRRAERRPAKRSRAPHKRQTRRCAIANHSLPSPAGDGPARHARVTSAKRFAVCCQRSAPQQTAPHKTHSDVCWPVPSGTRRKIPHPRKKEKFPSL